MSENGVRSIRRMLVANRGEIACRISATCRRLGIEVAVVHAEADATARHVRLADRALLVPAGRPAAAYLDRDAIVRAALDAGCDAVHPGYGFLSEDPGFAAAVEEAGIRFVGPRPETIRQMADKLRARRRAREAGLRVLPGSDDYVTSAAQAKDTAASIGYPVLVKAVQGGGGIGMARADDGDDLDTVYGRMTVAADRYFGDSRVLVERFLSRARHVEVQIVGDGNGQALHLGDRDCTVQRRNQKVVEEAPAADIPDAVRAEMHAQALALAQDLRYRGVGTVEMLLSGGTPYFLEMNTRLQVEHPVTEMTSGWDLVEAQIRIAEQGRLPSARPPAARGHAVECRVYAEDPVAFRPSPGTITVLELPGGQGVRVDSGYDAGDEVTPFFDPLVLKLITHAEDRPTAVDAMQQALSELRIRGLTTNLRALEAVLRDEEFRAMRHDLSFLSKLRLTERATP